MIGGEADLNSDGICGRQHADDDTAASTAKIPGCYAMHK